MVIRISYIYTTEEQYEMTNRITKELTKLEKTDAENSMFRPIDGFVQSNYNIIEIIIIQIILSER